ncbi:hypothetical protein OG625_36590 [Streptomyces sp. NBC_01351]|uniref:hypothetical protein n=1 Tax=Streptomyces sp. NBC_01351 TaxID=2903833 RepID=UPI002E37DD76|nr:hypothetical protein [Streptomyces sp. NBC_01351]
MRRGRPSEGQLRANFESALAGALEGRGVRTETGLDQQAEKALWAIIRARPDVPDELVAAARQAFAGQLDGSNAVQRRAEMARRLADRASRGNPTPGRPDTP